MHGVRLLEAECAPVTARPRGRPRKAPEPRRAKILAAAADLFISQGYSDTTLEAVGKAAGVHKRAIYELVGDKEQLFHAVCRHSYAAVGEDEFTIESRAADLRGSLVALARGLLVNALSERTIALERTIAAEYRRFPELIGNIVQTGHVECKQKIVDFFTDLEALGMMEVSDKHEAAQVFYDLLVSQYGLRKMLGYDEGDPTPEFIAARVEIFIVALPRI